MHASFGILGDEKERLNTSENGNRREIRMAETGNHFQKTKEVGATILSPIFERGMVASSCMLRIRKVGETCAYCFIWNTLCLNSAGFEKLTKFEFKSLHKSNCH